MENKDIGMKDRILEVALELFAKNGYEATTVDQIAKALGIKAPSLYAHYKSKNDIYRKLVEKLSTVYDQNSYFTKTDWNDKSQDHTRFLTMTADDAVKAVKNQIQLSIHNKNISLFRKLMTIEQYRNPELGKMQSKRSYEDILDFHKGVFSYLMDNNVMKKADPEVLALQYMAPISLMIYLCDREPEREQEAMNIVEKHIREFYNAHMNP